MSFVMKYCPTSTVVRNPASIQNLLTLSCCDNFPIRSSYLCNRNSLCAGSSFKSMFCPGHTWHERWVGLSFHNKSPCSIVARVTFFTHFCDCSVKTELIYRNNCAKNSFNRSWVGATVYSQFFPPLLLSTPLDNGLVDRKTGCVLSANVNITCSAILSHFPCGLSSLIEHHFFSDPGPRNDHCPAHLFAERETS